VVRGHRQSSGIVGDNEKTKMTHRKKKVLCMRRCPYLYAQPMSKLGRGKSSINSHIKVADKIPFMIQRSGGTSKTVD